MTNDERNPNSECRTVRHGLEMISDFDHWLFIRHLTFVIRLSSFGRSCAVAAPRKLWARSPRQLPAVRLGVTPMFLAGGLFVRERFAAQLDINFLHLPGQTIANI